MGAETKSRKPARGPMRLKLHERRRFWGQAGFTLLTNANLGGFFRGKIYQGGLKQVCVPGLNCYSCPGALGSCPLGSWQSLVLDPLVKIPYYVIGFLLGFGLIFGRLICGRLCPFGWFQELLYKIPLPKLKLSRSGKLDRLLRNVKFVLLSFLVLIFPVLAWQELVKSPLFCQYVCPAGTVSGGWPLLLAGADPGLRLMLGWVFSWKTALTILIILLSMTLFRPFCRYVCPLGAWYGLCNKFSLYQLNFTPSACVDCGLCERECPMDIEVRKNLNSVECIRCGRCKAVCPTAALNSNWSGKRHENI